MQAARCDDSPSGSPLADSNCQTATPLRLSRAISPRELIFDFAPRMWSAYFAPSKEGAERRMAHPGCLPFAKDRRRPCEAGSPYGAPLRRLEVLGAPLSFAAAGIATGKVTDIDPRPRNGPGGCPPRTPGTAVSKPRAQAPLHHVHARSSAPRRMGACRCKRRDEIRRSHRRNRPSRRARQTNRLHSHCIVTAGTSGQRPALVMEPAACFDADAEWSASPTAASRRSPQRSRQSAPETRAPAQAPCAAPVRARARPGPRRR